MIEPIIVVTNNPMAKDQFECKYDLKFIDGNVMEVLRVIRDYIHIGHRLITHPLISSIKPNEIPYKTVILSRNRDNTIDMMSLNLIEESVNVTQKFLKDFSIPYWNKGILQDFQVIDCDLISQGMSR